MTTLTPAEVYTEGLPGWSVLASSVPVLRTIAKTGSFAEGLKLTARVGELAEAANHHPDIHLTYPHVVFTLTTHDAGGLTRADLDLARQISAVAADLSIELAPASGQVVEVAIDAVDIPGVRPFWKAILGYTDGRDDDLLDARGLGPLIWFQQMERMRPDRNRLHIDVHVDADVAPERVRAALAAGGHLVDDSAAPAFWVFADAEGNEACVCTWQNR